MLAPTLAPRKFVSIANVRSFEQSRLAVIPAASSSAESVLDAAEPPRRGMLAKTRWRIGRQRNEVLAELVQAGPGSREAGMAAVHDADMMRYQRDHGAEGADVLGDDHPALRGRRARGCRRRRATRAAAYSRRPRPRRRGSGHRRATPDNAHPAGTGPADAQTASRAWRRSHACNASSWLAWCRLTSSSISSR